jgi:hypothetical protein
MPSAGLERRSQQLSDRAATAIGSISSSSSFSTLKSRFNYSYRRVSLNNVKITASGNITEIVITKFYFRVCPKVMSDDMSNTTLD